MADYHEPWEHLSPQARDLHRALISLKEEIEAVDWYNQRVELATDPELKQVLAHNRDEEIEHACMTLEWLRRNMGKWDETLRTYLFNDSPITEAEAREKAGEAEAPARSLGIGSLKDRKDR
jgi:ferritin-like protein